MKKADKRVHMKNTSILILNFLKYPLFMGIILLLFLLWQGVFILQGGIGIEGSFLFLPFKVLPLLLFSALSTWLVLKIFNFKRYRKRISTIMGGVAVILSLVFQYQINSQKKQSFVFKNKNFSHLKAIKTNKNFKNRIVLSFIEYLNIMPLGSVDQMFLFQAAHSVHEVTLLLEIQKLTDDKNIKKTCKNYLSGHESPLNCISELQQDIYSNHLVSPVSNTFLASIGTLSALKTKDALTEKYPEDNVYISIKYTNNIIKRFMLAAKRSQEIFINHQSSAPSLLKIFEEKLNYDFLKTTIHKTGELFSSVDKKIAPLTIDNLKLKKELLEFKKLKNQFTLLKSNMANISKTQLTPPELKLRVENQLSRTKKESLLFQVASFFDTSLRKLTAEDFIKNKL